MNNSVLGLKQRLSTPTRVNLLVSAGSPAKKEILAEPIASLAKHGVNIFATHGTSRFLSERNIPNTEMFRMSEEGEPNIQTCLEEGKFHFIVNIPTDNPDRLERRDNESIRGTAAEQWIPCITDADYAVQTLLQLTHEIEQELFVYHEGDPSRPWDLMPYFLALIRNFGGWDVAHSHIDKACVGSRANLAMSMTLMEEKWKIFDIIKAGPAYSHKGLIERMRVVIDLMIAQGARRLTSFIDVDEIVKLGPIQAALEVREMYRGQIEILYATQPLHGVIHPEAREWYEKGCEYADIIGGLPSADRKHEDGFERHLRFIMDIAHATGKPLHVHIDQENNPLERDTERLAKAAIEEGLVGKVSGVHAISLAAQPIDEQYRVINLIKEAGMEIIICPRAALSMKPHEDKMTITHNSIAPFWRLLEAGVPMRFGPDNIWDIFQPFVNGNMQTEMEVLVEGVRYYVIEKLARLACGLKVEN